MSPPDPAAAIERCYRIFAAYPIPQQPLDVCTCPACADAALIAEMCRLPLRKIGVQHFYEYSDASKSPVQPADELKYFLPRLLELFAETDGREMALSEEEALERIGNCPPNTFSPAERRALDDFAGAYFARSLSRWPWQQPDLFTQLLTLAVGGFDVRPMLSMWQADNRPQSAANYATALIWNWQRNKGLYFAKKNNAEARALNTRLADWIHDAQCRRIFAERLRNFPGRCPDGAAEWETYYASHWQDGADYVLALTTP